MVILIPGGVILVCARVVPGDHMVPVVFQSLLWSGFSHSCDSVFRTRPFVLFKYSLSPPQSLQSSAAVPVPCLCLPCVIPALPAGVARPTDSLPVRRALDLELYSKS